MGAWGASSFENDDALDWAASVASPDDVRAPFERLKRESDAAGSAQAFEVEVDFASELIAAAETVAMLLGRKVAGFPRDLAERLAGAGEPDKLLYHQARHAVCHVLRRSELAELWAEATDENGENEWQAEITRLLDRLNPDVEYVPWEAEEIEAKVGAPIGTCAFCDGPIPRDELWGMNLYDATGLLGMGRGLWLHLPCLNARLHHKHAVLDLKFDPNNLPDLDKL